MKRNFLSKDLRLIIPINKCEFHKVSYSTVRLFKGVKLGNKIFTK